MEKYNAETMAIVPRKPTDLMLDAARKSTLGMGDVKKWSMLATNQKHALRYSAMLHAATDVEPVVPLSEVLELLQAKRCAHVDRAIQHYCNNLLSDIFLTLKQKYGVSE